jgi:hypothetical protein
VKEYEEIRHLPGHDEKDDRAREDEGEKKAEEGSARKAVRGFGRGCWLRVCAGSHIG